MNMLEYEKLKYIAKYPTGKLNSNAAVEDGEYPFFTCAHEIYKINSYSYEGEYVLLGGNNANGDFPVFYYNGKFDAYQRTYLIQSINPNYKTKYLYYAIQLRLKQMQKNASGTATKYLTLPILNSINIEKYDYDIQLKMISVLEKYDLLIENNNKRIKIFEQMVEEFYREWFSRKRINNQNAGICTYYKIKDILKFIRGISYSSEEISCEDGMNLINLKNINSYGGFRRDGYKKYNGKFKKEQVVKRYDLIMGITDMTQDRRTVGSVALIPTVKFDSVISADLVLIKSKINNIYLYCLFKFGGISKYISQFANGANVLHLRPDMIKNVQIPIANNEVIELFVKNVKPVFDEIEKLNLQNENLIKQRDLLLPRLISGKLEVK
ncbi:type I restriction enzyme S subunit [Longibaculum muris]|uniref:Type I restriction enzyme S subunit n=2 Tax=Longibaculum muris TaxID=1796628 RepID=A0A4R3ZBS3_9FIRM|nr:type I restriction modification DNA specificity domain protein [Candidatus Stoquefichus sp. KLE1796]TCW03067.1 type I restriction enzyme S subunit [Longibaculum muris]